MSTRSPSRRRRLTALLAAPLALAACLGDPGPSFDPAGPCVVDGSAPGAYLEIEALVPTTFEGRGPDRLDSGRNCSSENLGVLRDRGFEEIRFAGGVWDFGNDQFAALVVFRTEGLTAAVLTEFYETSARSAGRTQIVARTSPTIAGRAATRLDTTTGERLQTVVVWPNATTSAVNVVITHNLPDGKIQAAIEAFGDR